MLFRSRRGGLRFRVLPKGGRWERALLLNLTFWGDGGGDVLVGPRIAADVVTHVAWHDAASRAFTRLRVQRSADALLLGEAVASAFDLYLVGTLLAQNKRCAFLDTHVAAMADVAKDAGLGARAFQKLLLGVAAAPTRSFEDLRALLFDVSTGLLACATADAAQALLSTFEQRKHPFAPLLHQYALSTWVLYASAFSGRALKPQRVVRKIDAALRANPDASLDWLAAKWLAAVR